jgi:hypothetical protein
VRILDAARVIKSLATGTYTVTRRAAATYVDGEAVPGATSTFTVVGVETPASGRDLLRLPEGRRSTKTRMFYTASMLLVGAQAGAYEADQIEIDGDVWEVQKAGAWKAAAGYCEAIVQRVGEVQP